MAPGAKASMNHKCPICPKTFPDKKAVRNHIGTDSLVSARVHPCTLCKQQFCSAKALQQHQDSPSHDTMFECNQCGRTFRSNRGFQDHQRAKGHTGNTSPPGGTLTALPVPVEQQRSTPPRSRSTAVGTEVGWTVNSHTGRMMDMGLDEDWALCDKDCGWCGHCAESYFY